jgi:hypothetical protein
MLILRRKETHVTDAAKPAVEAIHRHPPDQQGEGSSLNWLAVFIAAGIVLLWLLFELQRMPVSATRGYEHVSGSPRTSCRPGNAHADGRLV